MELVARILNAIKKIENAKQGQTFRNTKAASATTNQEDINTSSASVVMESGNVDIAPSTISTIRAKLTQTGQQLLHQQHLQKRNC